MEMLNQAPIRTARSVHGCVLRVTNGRSVTVRINDRGPFVRGQVVDVSYLAAKTLGMTGRGVTKVKLEVVQ